jgi:hypothetical protein
VLPLALACSDKSGDQAKPAAGAKDEPAKAEPKAEAGAPDSKEVAGPAAAEGEELGPNPREVEPSGETREEVVDGLVLQVPTEWERVPARSSMRKAEFVVPGPGGDVRMIVYRFPGGAGGASKNIERWKAQITTKPGEEPQSQTLDVNGLTIGAVDSAGAYVGQSMPGAPPQPPIADARLFAAAIEGSGDPYYLKLVGQAATVDVWSEAWTQLLGELAAKG